MKVEAEVTIKILDGEEKGRTYTFATIGETNTQYTEYGIIECLRLEWNHIHNMVVPQESEVRNERIG